MATTPPVATVELAHKLMKLPYWPDFDAEALLAAYREKFGATALSITKPQLKELFLSLSYDKIEVEEQEVPEDEGGGGGEADGEEEGDSERPPPPPPKEKISEYAEATYALIATTSESSLPITRLFTILQLCKAGYGEPSLRFAAKLEDAASAGTLTEAQLWTAITACANSTLDAVVRNHLRRAWRAAEKHSAGSGEEGGESAGGDEAEAEAEGDTLTGVDAPAVATGTPAQPAEVKVMVDSFFTLLAEDERLTSVLLKELPIPEPPADADDNPPPAED